MGDDKHTMGDDKHTRSQSPGSVVDTIRKRRRPVANSEFEVDSKLTSDKEKYDDDNTGKHEDCGGDSEQFQTATEEDKQNEDEIAKDGQEEEIVASEAMEANIQLIREKMERFTQQVSGLLEAGKNFFLEMSNEFEERIILIHQKQINKWQEEIQLLRTVDSMNEDISARLHDAQYLLHAVQMDS